MCNFTPRFGAREQNDRRESDLKSKTEEWWVEERKRREKNENEDRKPEDR